MKKLLLMAALLVAALSARAQVDIEKEFFSLPDSVTTSFLDSIDVQIAPPNDYWLVGVYGGASVQYGFHNPDRNVKAMWNYPMYGFSVIRHFAMFGIFHNMALEMGAQMNYEGYEYKYNQETDYRSTESGAYKAVMKVPEVFMLSHFHIDMGEHFKVLAKAGIYGGYRTSIQRTLDESFAQSTYTQYENQFRDYDKRFTYGVQGGLGFGLMFSPIEFHVNAQVKWGWESFWQPNYSSPYYYRFAWPLDGAITFGVYYQLSPRYGHTKGQLKKLARKMIQEANNE